MTDGLRSKSESFSMWVKSTLLSLSCINPIAQPGRCHGAMPQLPLVLSWHNAGHSTSQSLCSQPWVSLDHICSVREAPASRWARGRTKVVPSWCSPPWAAAGKGTQQSPAAVGSSEMHLGAHREQESSISRGIFLLLAVQCSAHNSCCTLIYSGMINSWEGSSALSVPPCTESSEHRRGHLRAHTPAQPGGVA